MPAAGLSSATMLLFAAAVATLSTDPAIQQLSRPGNLAVLLATISCCVVLMGALQMLFGWLRLGAVAKFVPQPVLAGFMNSVAVLMVIALLPACSALAEPTRAGPCPRCLRGTRDAARRAGHRGERVAHRLALAARPGRLLGMISAARSTPSSPSPGRGSRSGPQVGPLPQQLPLPDVLMPLFATSTAPELFLRHAETCS